jgi:hypothetical protein
MRRLAKMLLVVAITLIPASASAKPRAERLEDSYGVGEIRAGDKAWTDAELRIVEASLKKLSAEELPGVRGVQLVRMRRSPRLFGTGLYKVDKKGPRILVYDRAFAGPGKGSASKPNHTLIHEFGHAIAHKAVRVATRRAERAIDKANDLVDGYNTEVRNYNRLVREYNAGRDAKVRSRITVSGRRVNRLARDATDARKKSRKLSRTAAALHRDHRSPFPTSGVLRDYKLTLGWALGPTPYGRLNLQESFAESFMLHHCAPKQLKKRLPKVYKWLVGDGHLNPTR